MSQYPDELGSWPTGFPAATVWLARALSCHPSVIFAGRKMKYMLRLEAGVGAQAGHSSGPARAGQVLGGGAVAARDGRRDPEAVPQVGRDHAGSVFGGTGKTDVAVTLAAIYAAARPADRVILADRNEICLMGRSGSAEYRSRRCRRPSGRCPSGALTRRVRTRASRSTRICAMQSPAPGRGRDPWRHRRRVRGD